MPTLGETFENLRKKGKYDTFVANYKAAVGVDPSQVDPSMPFDEFMYRSRAFKAGQKFLKPLDETRQALTHTNDFQDSLESMSVIGQALAGKPDPKKAAEKHNYDSIHDRVNNSWAASKRDFRPRNPFTLDDVTPESPLGAGRLVVGGLAGAAEGAASTVSDYAKQLLLMRMTHSSNLAGKPKNIGPQRTTRKLSPNFETPGDELKHNVLDKRMQMPIIHRGIEGFNEAAKAMFAIGGAALGSGTPQEQWDLGEAIGKGAVRETAGTIERALIDPAGLAEAQPFEIGTMAMGPAARSVGAGTRAALAAGRGSKAAAKMGKFRHVGETAGRVGDFVADALDPQKPIRRSVDEAMQVTDLNPAMAREFNELQRLHETGVLSDEVFKKASDAFAEKHGVNYETVYKSLEGKESAGSIAGRGARRAFGGALMLGEAMGGSPKALVIAAGLGAFGPPAIKAAGSKLMTRYARDKIARSVVDPNRILDPIDEEIARRSSVDPNKMGMGVAATGHEVSARASAAGPEGVGVTDAFPPAKWSEKNIHADPEAGGFTAPPGTVAHQLALESGRQAESAAVHGGKAQATALSAEAKLASKAIADAMPEGDRPSPNFFLNTSRRYVKAAAKLKEKMAETAALRGKLEDAKKIAPAAYRLLLVRRAKMAARAEYVDAKVRASLNDHIKSEGRDAATAALHEAAQLERDAKSKAELLRIEQPKAAELLKKEAELDSLKRILAATELSEKTGRVSEEASSSTKPSRKFVNSKDPLVMVKSASPEHVARIVAQIKKEKGGQAVIDSGRAKGLTDKQIVKNVLDVKTVTSERLRQIVHKTKQFEKGVDEQISSGPIANRAKELGASSRDMVVHLINAEEIELAALKKNFENYGAYQDALTAQKTAAKAFDGIKTNYMSVVERASKAANRLYESERAKKAANARSKMTAEEIVAASGKSGAERAQSASRRMQIAEDFVQKLESDNKSLKAANASRLRIIEDGNAQRVLSLVEESHNQTKRAEDAFKAEADFPQTQKGMERVSGQDQPMGTIGRTTQKIDAEGNPIFEKDAFGKEVPVTHKLAETYTDPTTKAHIEATVKLFQRHSPNSKMAKPGYLAQLLATVEQKKAFALAFSKRSRAYVASAFADTVMDRFPTTDWRPHNARAWFKSEFGTEIPTKGFSRKKFRNAVRGALEKKISEDMAAAAMGGSLTDLRITVPGVDGRVMTAAERAAGVADPSKQIVFSVADTAGKFLSKDRKNPLTEGQRQAIKAEAASGVFESIRTQLTTDAMNSSVAKEAMRGMAHGAVDERSHGLASLARMLEGEHPSNVVLFDPAVLNSQFANSPEARNSFRAALSRYMGDPSKFYSDQKIREALNYFLQNYGESKKGNNPEVAAAMMTGMRLQGVPVQPGSRVFVKTGYGDVVGSSIRFNSAMQEARGILSKAGKLAQTTQLAHSLAPQAANLASNTMTIWSSLGISPPQAMMGIGKTYHTMWTKYETGKMTGIEAKVWDAVMRTGVADSSQLTSRMMGLIEGGSSQGAFGKLKAYNQFWKEVYKQGDAGPKLFLTINQMHKSMNAVGVLEIGTPMQLPLGKGRFIEVQRTSDGFVRFGKRKLAMDSPEALGYLAEHSKIFADSTLFDMNDMPGFVRGAVGRHSVAMSIFNAYFPWAFKASEWPGKKGLMSNIAAYDPLGGIQTNSVAINKLRAKEFAKLAMRRTVIQAGLRSAAQERDDQGLSKYTGWDATSNPILMNPYSTDMAVVETMDLGSMTPAVMADAALRIMNTATLEVSGRVSKLARGAGMTYIANLFGKSREQYRDVINNPDKYNETERNAARLYQLHTSGNITSLKMVASYLGLTGGMFNQFVTDLDKGRFRTGTQLQFLRMTVGGTATAMLEAAGEAADPTANMTSRKMLKQTDTGARKENFGKWWFANLFRFGFRERQLLGSDGGVERYITRRKSMINAAYIKPLEDRKKVARSKLGEALRRKEGVAKRTDPEGEALFNDYSQKVVEWEKTISNISNKIGENRRWANETANQFSAAARKARFEFNENRRRVAAKKRPPNIGRALKEASKYKSPLASPEVQGAFSR